MVIPWEFSPDVQELPDVLSKTSWHNFAKDFQNLNIDIWQTFHYSELNKKTRVDTKF